MRSNRGHGMMGDVQICTDGVIAVVEVWFNCTSCSDFGMVAGPKRAINPMEHVTFEMGNHSIGHHNRQNSNTVFNTLLHEAAVLE
jgi:hypothetical protein